MVIRYHNQPDNKVVSEAHVTFPNDVRWTEPTIFDPRKPFNVSVSGTFDSSIVTLQRSLDNAATWLDVWTTTEAAELVVDTVEEDVLWRCGMRVGDTNVNTDLLVRMSQWG